MGSTPTEGIMITHHERKNRRLSMAMYIESGHSYSEVMTAFNISKRAIIKACKEYGVKYPLLYRRITYDKVVKYLQDKDLSLSEIARMCNLSRQRIQQINKIAIKEGIVSIKSKRLKTEKKIYKFICLRCGNPFETINKEKKYCNRDCRKNYKIDWPRNLPELIMASTLRQVSIKLGVSSQSVTRRLKKYHGWTESDFRICDGRSKK